MNNTIFYFFYNLAHQSALLDNVIVFLAVYLPYVIVFLAGVFLLMHHEILRAENPFQVLMQKKKEIILVFFSSFLAYFTAVLLKLLFHTMRPYQALPQVYALFPENSFAFPSGHTSFFAALAFAIFFFHKKAGYILMALAIVVGLARVTAGVHFPIDILGGFVFGALVAFLVKRV